MAANNKLNRRRFVKTAAAATIAAPTIVSATAVAGPSPNDRLSFACIGMGGQMQGYLIPELSKVDQQVVAVCDVDKRQIAAAKARRQEVAGAREYQDYRELLEKEADVDAIIIGTPDHWHVPVSLAAMNKGKHVYCEKPLAHSVAECQALEELALANPDIATQTGNQGCATEGFRRSYEVIRAGVLGEVTEVHVWHPAHGWPSGVDRPADSDPIPEGLDWDFWLGTSAERPYKNGIYHPAQWRGWYDFGGGSMADFCCHGFQLAYRALELGMPTYIEAEGEGLGHESFATRCKVAFDFPGNENRGPVKLFFYSGDKHFPPDEVTRGPVATTGCLVVGKDATLSAGLWNTDCNVRFHDSENFQGANHPEVAKVPKSEPRIDTEVLKWDPRRAAKGERPRWSRVNNSHMFEWVLACAGDAKAYSPFEVGARITEIGMLGVLALRMQQPIRWDAENRRAIDLPAANALINPAPRGSTYL